MNNNEEKDLLSYLEGEIKYDEEKGLITIKDEPVIDIYGFGPKIYDHELGHFVTQLLINERERRKMFNRYGAISHDLITPKKEG